MQTEFVIVGGLLVAVLVLQVLALLRRQDGGRLEQALREEARQGRAELRELVEAQARQQGERLDSFARNLIDLSTRTDARLDQLRDALGEDARKAREESAAAQQRNGELLAAIRTRASAPSASSWPSWSRAATRTWRRCARAWPRMRARRARNPWNPSSVSPTRWACA